jgi:hypothetical protein
MLHRVSGFLFLLIFFFSQSTSLVFAQDDSSESSAFIFPPDPSKFPEISTYLIPRDASGEFIHGLQAEDLTIIEDENQISEMVVEELRSGVQVAIAILPGPAFALRNSQAESRYDSLLSTLKNWATSKDGSNLDDLSLIIAEGGRVVHTNDPLDLIPILDTPVENIRQAVPNLDVAFQAVEIAADTPARPGMGKTTFLITPPLDNSYSQSFENLAARAKEQGVRIFSWMVGPDDPSTQQAADRLRSLAEVTGGKFNVFEEETDLQIENYLDSLRETYRISYQSQIRSSGIHTVAMEVRAEQGITLSNTQSFELNILPPVPAFVLPPLEIVKKPVIENDQNPSEIPLNEYIPKSQELQIVFDYPDGLVRPIVRSQLFIDGVLTVENTQPPFDKFTWDISEYPSTNTHSLRVEAEDSLGLVGSSFESQVQVTVLIPEPDWISIVSGNLPVFIGLAILLSGALFFLGLTLAGRLKPHQPGKDKLSRKRKKVLGPLAKSLVVPADVPHARSAWTSRLQWPHRPSKSRILAYLTPIETKSIEKSPTGGNNGGNGIIAPPPSLQSPSPIRTEELTIGSDPGQALLSLTDPSVEGLHTRLCYLPDQTFMIYDYGTVAGTWINYEQVTSDGTRLVHGDVIRIGRSEFRFSLYHPANTRKTVSPDPKRAKA